MNGPDNALIYQGGAWTEKRMHSPPHRLHYEIVANAAMQ
jgi:hypothetical protein